MKEVPNNILRAWAKEIKEWYGVECDDLEILRRASHRFDRKDYYGRPYDQVFLRKGNTWHKKLDTADREYFAEYVAQELSRK